MDSKNRNQDDSLPHAMLPSHLYRYTVWHELNAPVNKGNELKAPRVREGPTEKEELFYRLREDNNRAIHHSKHGRERRDYRDETENWGECLVMNLSYQDLSHDYQFENLSRVLNELKKVERLNINDNNIINLRDVKLPSCEQLKLSRNYIKNIKDLPQLPKIQCLMIEQNYIKDLTGLETLRSTPLRDLYLKGNPVAFSLNYRQRVFQKLPDLKRLDGLPRQESDSQLIDDYKGKPESPSSCVVS